MIDYEKLKMLFNIKEDTLYAYEMLSAAINKNSKDLLYICKTKEDAHLQYNQIIEKFKYCINKKDKQKGIIEFNNKDKIYIWTISRVESQIDGYRFRDIRFR